MQLYVKPSLSDEEDFTGGRGRVKGSAAGKKGKTAKVINATPATANMTGTFWKMCLLFIPADSHMYDPVLVRTKPRGGQRGGDVPVMVKGRMRCDCEAREHPLVQNCVQVPRAPLYYATNHSLVYSTTHSQADPMFK